MSRTQLNLFQLLTLGEVINFVFKSTVRKRIGFSKTSIYWTSKGSGRRYFSKEPFVNKVYKQDIGIPMGINSAPFGANFFLYFFEP